MKQRNNHARSKRKRKSLILKLKNFWRRVFEKRVEKRMKALKTKGHTLYGKGRAKEVAHYVNGGGWFMDNRFHMTINQRQKRKRRRQQPHGRK